jgi:hypothetical protein
MNTLFTRSWLASAVMNKKALKHTWIASLLLVVASISVAAPIPEAREVSDKSARFGDYEVYFTAFPSTFITPEIASTYKLERGPKNGLVNIAVRNVKSSEMGKAVPATLKGKTVNLLGQESTLKFKKIQEGDAIYYLAGFRFSHEEMLRFSINVQPEGSRQSHTIELSKQFYEDGK